MKIFWTLVCLTFGSIATAQVDTISKRQPLNSYGLDIKNLRVTTSLVPPSDTSQLRIADTGAIAVINGKQYLWTRNKIWVGPGTVTNVSATNATGQSWSIANSTSTPNISLTLTKDAVGLSAVDNTSDANKPVSTATATALDGKASSAHTHTQSDVTSLVSDLAGKSASVHTHVISDVTSLQSTIDGKVADAINNETTTIAPSQNAVFDEFYKRDIHKNVVAAIGTTTKGETITKFWEVSLATPMTDGTIRWFPIWIYEPGTISTIDWFQNTVGNYVPDNENAIKLFTYSAGSVAEVATTGNIPALWSTGANNILKSANFTTPYVASAGLHWLAMIYNNSSASTNPTIGANTSTIQLPLQSVGLSNSVKLSATTTGTSIPSSQALSSTTASAFNTWARLH